MTEKDREPDIGQGAGDASGKKKPYLKPAFRSEEIFERTALTCGKVQSTSLLCHSMRKNS